MAIFTPGGGVAAIRGAVGGNVYSANRSGPYIRNRAMPIDPGSARQQAVRFAMASLVTRWVEVLTPAQRASWDKGALRYRYQAEQPPASPQARLRTSQSTTRSWLWPRPPI